MIPNSAVIEAVSGRLIDIANPKPDDFDAEDIAWALSREPRFSGHTLYDEAYTVGQHSIQVCDFILEALEEDGEMHRSLIRYFTYQLGSDWLSVLYRFMDQHKHNLAWVGRLGLLHDASEAYLRDIPSPIKNMPGFKEEYAKLENSIMGAILTQFGFDEIDEQSMQLAWKIVHWADLYTRTIEAHHLIRSKGSHWGEEYKISDANVDRFIPPQNQIEMYKTFLAVLDILS